MCLRSALFFAGLSAALLGQGVVPPFQIGQVNPLPGLSVLRILHTHLIHLPADPPSVFYCAVTANTGLLCGSYDVLTDTFTPNNEAAALNTTGREIGMTLHHSGLLAVFDRINGWAWLASRPAIGQPWQVVGQIGPLYGQGHYNPALADYRGQLYLLYSIEYTPNNTPGSIVMQRIDPITAQVSGPPIEIVRRAGINSSANSPIPVTDPNGELIGVSHYDWRPYPPYDCDHYMSLDLDPSTPSVLMNDATTWTGPGGFVGGRFFDADSSFPSHIFAIDTFWFTGGRAPVGGTMHVRMFTPPTSGLQPYASLFAVGSAFLPAGLPIPGVPGLVGIAAGGWTSALFVHNNANGEARTSFVIPNSPGLSGVRLCAQSATIEAGIGTVRLGNTAMLTVD